MNDEMPTRSVLEGEYSNEELATLLEEKQVELNRLAEIVDRGLLNEDEVLGEHEVLGLKDAIEDLDAIGFALVCRIEDVSLSEV